MLVIYGVKGSRTYQGKTTDIQCEQCQDQKHRIFKDYNYFHIYWVPILPLSSESFSVCHTCQHAGKVKSQPNLRRSQNSDPAHRPFWHWIGPAVIALFALNFTVMTMRSANPPLPKDRYVGCEKFKGEQRAVCSVAKYAKVNKWEETQAVAKSFSRRLKDPELAGWVEFYLFRAYFERQRYSDALKQFEYVRGKKNKYLVFGQNNAAYMHSVALELAYRVNDQAKFHAIYKMALKAAKGLPEHQRNIRNNYQMLGKEKGWVKAQNLAH